jgi:hypothetical protein
MDSMRAPISRRRFLKSTAAGLSTTAMPEMARAQLATQAPPKQVTADEFSVTAPVSIEVNARPLPSFDTRDHHHVRFGALEYRSGLILTSRFRGFGGLSGLRLDAKGERFISISDKGSWFTGRIVYRGREMTGLDDVEAAPMLGPDGRPITARGWFDSESIALDGPFVYIGLERVTSCFVSISARALRAHAARWRRCRRRRASCRSTRGWKRLSWYRKACRLRER